jgi:hypothetical protein
MRKFCHKVIGQFFLKTPVEVILFPDFKSLEKHTADSYLLLQLLRRDTSHASVSATVRLSTAASTEVSLWWVDQLWVDSVLHEVNEIWWNKFSVP